MSDGTVELGDYIMELELRLSDYHDRLEQVIADRDRLALDAAWGVHAAMFSFIAFGGTLYILNRMTPLTGFWSFLLAMIAGQFAAGLAYTWSNKERMNEVNRLAKLPGWEWKDPSWAERLRVEGFVS